MTGIIAYRFDNYELSISRRTLTRGGEPVPIVPKAFEVLITLIEGRDHVIEKDEIFLKVWDGQIIDENNLNQKISIIRKALNERNSGKKYILTIPGHGYRFTADVEEVLERDPNFHIPSDGPINTPSSIAILPFAIHSENEEPTDSGLELAESLIMRVAMTQRVSVSSTAMIAGLPPDLDPIIAGRKLGVDSILYGRMRLHRDSFQITVQLVSANYGSVIWATEYDITRSAHNTQTSEIADLIFPSLKEYLQHGQRIHHVECDTSGVDYVNELCLRGQYLCNKRTAADIRRGVQYFEQAIIVDPGFALAYAGLAQAHLLLGYYDRIPTTEVIQIAETAADTAIQLDPALAEAYAAKAYIRMAYRYDWEGSLTDFVKAIELNPIGNNVGLWYSRFLSAMRYHEEAVSMVLRTHKSEPLSIAAGADAGLILFFAGQLDEAEARLIKTIDIEPDDAPARLHYALVLEQKGMFHKSIREAQLAVELSADHPFFVSALGHIYAFDGRKKSASEQLEKLEAMMERGYVPPNYLSYVNLALGNHDKAIDQLFDACEDRAPWMMFLRVDPRLNILHGDPRFDEICSISGLNGRFSATTA